MQYSFLGFSVSKMMELSLDMKDIAILRYFVDFKDTGKMNTEVVEGVTYYWVSYRSIEEEVPYLALGKRAIMRRMLKLRDLGILNHYTKKEGRTFSFFTLGSKYMEITTINKALNREDNESNKVEYKNKLNNSNIAILNEINKEEIKAEAIKIEKEEDK